MRRNTAVIPAPDCNASPGLMPSWRPEHDGTLERASTFENPIKLGAATANLTVLGARFSFIPIAPFLVKKSETALLLSLTGIASTVSLPFFGPLVDTFGPD